MNKQVFETKVDELVREIGASLGDSGSEALANKTVDSKDTQKSRDRLESSLDNLSMGIRYVLFDLEATRRENAFLKTLIDNPES